MWYHIVRHSSSYDLHIVELLGASLPLIVDRLMIEMVAHRAMTARNLSSS